MSRKDVILFQPLDKLPYFSNALEPITVELLASVIEQKGYKATVLGTDATEEDLINAIKKTQPLAVGLSVHSYVHFTSLALAKATKIAAKELNINITTILGGYHPTALPDEVAIDPHVDYVVIGEGELTLCELLAAIENNKSTENIDGLAYTENGKIIKTQPRTRVKNLDIFPWAKREKQFLSLTAQHSIHYPAANDQKGVAKIPFGRGCPYGCPFCQARNLLGTEIYWRSPKDILDEVEHLIEIYNIDYLIFLDLTFNFNEKKVIELCDEFIKRDLPVHWGVNVRADILTENQLLAMKKAKCSKISVGVESPVEEYSKKLKGHYNINHKHLVNILNFADNLGIIIRLYLMLGLPYETKELILSYPKAWRELPFDELLMAFASPLPATEFFDECLQKNLISYPIEWQHCNMEEPTFPLPSLTKEELTQLRWVLYQKSYFHDSYMNHVKDKLKKFPHLASSWKEHIHAAEPYGMTIGYEKEYAKLCEIISTAS